MTTQSTEIQQLTSQISELKKINSDLQAVVKKLHHEVFQSKQMIKKVVENTNRNRKDINNIVQKLSR